MRVHANIPWRVGVDAESEAMLDLPETWSTGVTGYRPPRRAVPPWAAHVACPTIRRPHHRLLPRGRILLRRRALRGSRGPFLLWLSRSLRLSGDGRAARAQVWALPRWSANSTNCLPPTSSWCAPESIPQHSQPTRGSEARHNTEGSGATTCASRWNPWRERSRRLMRPVHGLTRRSLI